MNNVNVLQEWTKWIVVFPPIPCLFAYWSSFFSRFDIDGRGQIDQKDLVKVIQDIGEGQSYDQIRSTIKAVDINATGKVEVDEFLEVKKNRATRDGLIQQRYGRIEQPRGLSSHCNQT